MSLILFCILLNSFLKRKKKILLFEKFNYFAIFKTESPPKMDFDFIKLFKIQNVLLIYNVLEHPGHNNNAKHYMQMYLYHIKNNLMKLT